MYLYALADGGALKKLRFDLGFIFQLLFFFPFNNDCHKNSLPH